MKRLMAILALGILVSGCTETAPPTADELKNTIREKLQPLEGTFAVAFKSLTDSSQTVFINERELFHAASTMKTPVMIELFKQAEAGKFSLSDSVEITNEFRSIVDSSRYRMEVDEDSKGDLYELIGQKRTIRRLIDDMITMSSNLATNILMEKVGAKNVTQTMRSYGAESIQVLRGVEDIKAYERGLSNRTASLDEAIIYERIGSGEAVSEKASQEMIEILKRQHFNDMIPAGLPEEVEVAHKTGWITGVQHDAGLIMMPGGRKYVLVLLSKDAPERDRVVRTFADISREVYEYVLAGE